MKDALIGLGVFIIMCGLAILEVVFTQSPTECFDDAGKQICDQLLPLSVLEPDPIFDARYRFTNHTDKTILIPRKTVPEFCSFLSATDVGSGNVNVDVCRIDHPLPAGPHIVFFPRNF